MQDRLLHTITHTPRTAAALTAAQPPTQHLSLFQTPYNAPTNPNRVAFHTLVWMPR